MMGVCLHYSKDDDEAKEILQMKNTVEMLKKK